MYDVPLQMSNEFLALACSDPAVHPLVSRPKPSWLKGPLRRVVLLALPKWSSDRQRIMQALNVSTADFSCFHTMPLKHQSKLCKMRPSSDATPLDSLLLHAKHLEIWSYENLCVIDLLCVLLPASETQWNQQMSALFPPNHFAVALTLLTCVEY